MILDILKELSADAGKIYKQEVLAKHKDNELFQEVLQLVYNPNITFYMKEIPEDIKEGAQRGYMLEMALDELAAVHKRDVTGHDALDHVKSILDKLDADDCEVIRRIIDKDIKCGISAKSVNKTFGAGFIPTSPYMGAVSFAEKKARKIFEGGKRALSEVKMDGRYCNEVLNGENVSMLSRQGKSSFIDSKGLIENAKQINAKLDEFGPIVLNGELIMRGVDRYTSNGIIASLIKIQEKIDDGKDVTKEFAKFEKKHKMAFEEAVDAVTYVVWDFIPYDIYVKAGTFEVEREDRLKKLADAIHENEYIQLIEYKYVDTYEEAIAHFREMVARGEEGTILKALTGFWENKKPTHQVKMKLEMTIDLKIIGFNEGKKGTKYEGTLGSFICTSDDGKLNADPGGIAEDIRDKVWASQDHYLNTIIEVKCNGISHNRDGEYSLLHPVFNHFRDDKDRADTFEEIQANQDMIMGLT